MAGRKRRNWSAGDKRKVLEDVERLGISGAAKAHDTTASNVSRWRAEGERWLSEGGLAADVAPNRKASPSAKARTPSARGSLRSSRRATKGAGPTPVARSRVWTAEDKRRALADVERLGICGAAKVHKTTASNVSRWWSERERWLGSDAQENGAEPKGQAAASGKEVTPTRNGASKTRPPDRPKTSAPAKTAAARRIARRYTPSERAAIVELAAREGVTVASTESGASRWSIHAWQRKVARAAAGEGPDPTSGPSVSEIEERRDREILNEWHKQPGLGPSQIRNQLRRQGVKVSVATARRVMEEAGYRPPKVKRQPHDERFESVRPNQMWHLDYVHRHINRTGAHTLILIDDHSRFVVGHGVDDAERADMAIRTFETAVQRHGRPESVLHDKGSAFWSWRGISRFTAVLTEMGIDQIAAEHKEWNGKVEVFNANLHKELFDQHRFYDLAEMKRRLTTHLHWYNHARTHHALGGLLVPADRYYGRVEEVTARIEAGAGRELGDGLDLRERCLELFKVTSTSGVPEVFLLGRKLLGASSP